MRLEIRGGVQFFVDTLYYYFNFNIQAFPFFSFHNILTSKGLDVLGTVYNKTDKTQSKISSYLGNFVIHVAITELLMQLELQPDYLYGSSIGIFSALYLDGFIQLEEAVHCAYLYSTLVWSITDEQRKSPQVRRLLLYACIANIIAHYRI